MPFKTIWSCPLGAFQRVPPPAAPPRGRLVSCIPNMQIAETEKTAGACPGIAVFLILILLIFVVVLLLIFLLLFL